MDATNEMQIKVLKQENEDLRELLEIQEGKLERAMFAIYHLHAGLYNQISQRYILAKKNALLSGEPLLVEEEQDEEQDEEQEFTTRQGDRNELRIRQMEQTIKILEEKIESFATNTNKFLIN